MNECARCHASLEDLSEIHAVYGNLFCSKECAVEHLRLSIIHTAAEAASEEYDNVAEVVGPDILDNGHKEVIKVLCRRDGISVAEAVKRVERVKELILHHGMAYDETETLLVEELGLEMDYIMDIMS